MPSVITCPALKWMQEGSLRISSDKAWQFSLPGNGEIIEMLALATGKQFLVPLGSWVASIVLATAAYSLAVRFSNGAKAPALCAILVVFSIPMVEFQAFSAYVDIFGTGFLFAAHVSEWWIYPWTEWLNSFGDDVPTVYGKASGLGGAFATFVVVG